MIRRSSGARRAFRGARAMCHAVRMQRDVTAHLELNVSDPADLVVAIAVSAHYEPDHESFTALLDGVPVPITTFADHSGTRFQRLQAGAGTLVVRLGYRGAGFAGFARQPSERTVEGELCRALETTLRREVELTCAGRTDAGGWLESGCESG